jgi:flagellar hook-associated protein 3 FlgL
MELRVSQQTMVNQAIFYEQQQTAALSHLQQQASSGNRILAPEDDPLGAVAVINYPAQDAGYSTDLANINPATDALNVGVSTLQDASNIIVNASSLTIQATNGGNDQTALNAIATQVDALLKRLTDLANTQNNGQYIFGGTKSQAQPFVTDAAGNVTYDGSTQRAGVPIGPS